MKLFFCYCAWFFPFDIMKYSQKSTIYITLAFSWLYPRCIVLLVSELLFFSLQKDADEIRDIGSRDAVDVRGPAVRIIC